MSKVKKQHIVPRFYLENFTDLKGKIFTFDLRTKTEFATSAENIAHLNYFYDYEPLDSFVGNQFIETQLSKLESDISILIQQTIETLKQATSNEDVCIDREAFARYILIQQRRTMESRVLNDHAAKELERQLRAKGATDNFIELHRLASSDHDPKLEQIIALLYLQMHDVDVSELCNRYWIYWKNNTAVKFYTSDHPVVGFTYEDLSHNAYELFFPLTPDFAISILIKDHFHSWANKNNKVVELDNPEFIQFYNSLLVNNCNRQVYNSNDNFELVKSLLAQRPELSNPDRQRFAKM